MTFPEHERPTWVDDAFHARGLERLLGLVDASDGAPVDPWGPGVTPLHLALLGAIAPTVGFARSSSHWRLCRAINALGLKSSTTSSRDDLQRKRRRQERRRTLVSELVRRGASVSVRTGLRHIGSPLVLAVLTTDLSLALPVLRAATKDELRHAMDGEEPPGWTLVQLAADVGSLDLVRWLVEVGGLPPRTEDGSAMEVAAARGATEIVAFLTTRDHTRLYPMFAALRHGRLKVVCLLHRLGTRCHHVDVYGQPMLHVALASGHRDVAEFVLRHGEVDVRAVCRRDGLSALHVAAQYAAPEIVRLMLQLGADPRVQAAGDGERMTPLHVAALHGRLEILDVLVDDGGASWDDVTGRTRWTVMHYAACGGHVGMYREFQRRGWARGFETPCVTGGLVVPPIVLAAQHGRVDFVRWCLDAGVDVDTPSADGCTALHWAVPLGHVDVVHVLLGAGADVEWVGHDGVTCLQKAATGGNDAMLRVLLQHGADVAASQRMPDGRTLLGLAAASGHVARVELLLATGHLDVNARDGDGTNATALHIASRTPMALGVISVLVAWGGDLDARDARGRTPVDVAVGAGHDTMIVRWLVGHGIGDVDLDPTPDAIALATITTEPTPTSPSVQCTLL